ncbi:MAG: hypothetical protein AB4290_31510 [Spirulina sp.]
MIRSLAIERKTFAQLHSEFAVTRTEKDDFFPEWHRDLKELTPTEKTLLNLFCHSGESIIEVKWLKADGVRLRNRTRERAIPIRNWETPCSI